MTNEKGRICYAPYGLTFENRKTFPFYLLGKLRKERKADKVLLKRIWDEYHEGVG